MNKPASFAEATKNGLPKRSFAYTPSDNPSDWALPYLDAQGAPDTAHLAAAAAALSEGGYRGQKATIPDAALTSVKAKLRQAYRRAGKSPAEMPAALAETYTPSRPSYVTELLAEEAMQPAYVIEALADESFGEAHAGHFFGNWRAAKRGWSGPPPPGAGPIGHPEGSPEYNREYGIGRNPSDTSSGGPFPLHTRQDATRYESEHGVLVDPTVVGGRPSALAGGLYVDAPRGQARAGGDVYYRNRKTGEWVLGGKTNGQGGTTLHMAQPVPQDIQAYLDRAYKNVITSRTYGGSTIHESGCPDCDDLIAEAHAGHFFGAWPPDGGHDAMARVRSNAMEMRAETTPSVSHGETIGTQPLPDAQRPDWTRDSVQLADLNKTDAWNKPKVSPGGGIGGAKFPQIEGDTFTYQKHGDGWHIVSHGSYGNTHGITSDLAQAYAGDERLIRLPVSDAVAKRLDALLGGIQESHAGHFFGNWRDAQAHHDSHYDAAGYLKPGVVHTDAQGYPLPGERSYRMDQSTPRPGDGTGTRMPDGGLVAPHVGQGRLGVTPRLRAAGFTDAEIAALRHPQPSASMVASGVNTPEARRYKRAVEKLVKANIGIAPADVLRESEFEESHFGHFFGAWGKHDTGSGSSIWSGHDKDHAWGQGNNLPKDPIERVRAYNDVRNAVTEDLTKADDVLTKFGARTTADAQLRTRIRAELERRKTLKPATPV